MAAKNQSSIFEEKKLYTGEINLNYAAGPNNGPPLVLIPGQTVSWENYKMVLEPLSKSFHVFAVDVRGHGKSEWTPGNYSFETIGEDTAAFLEKAVKRPAFISGNSSGGLIALWLAANRPEYIQGIILEDPPLFSAEWPRIKDEHVYQVLADLVEVIETMNQLGDVRSLSEALQKIERPIEGSSKTKRFPGWLTRMIARIIRKHQRKGKRGKIASPYLPKKVNQLLEILTTFDSDFAKAWVDGRIYQGLNHEDALTKVKCPALLLHASWFRHEKFGLVGAMDDDDVKKALSLMPQCIYKKIDSTHVIHTAKPQIFVQEIEQFTKVALNQS